VEFSYFSESVCERGENKSIINRKYKKGKKKELFFTEFAIMIFILVLLDEDELEGATAEVVFL
jgi:hypothetical protein